MGEVEDIIFAERYFCRSKKKGDRKKPRFALWVVNGFHILQRNWKKKKNKNLHPN